MNKTLDEKLVRLQADSSCQDFILCDAKDPDLGAGLAAAGLDHTRGSAPNRFRSMGQLRDSIREVTRQGLVDIMLMSPSTSEVLTMEERMFDNSPVTPAARANDTTDVWCGFSGSYADQPALPFATTTIDHLMCGCYPGAASGRGRGVNLALFSMTFNNCPHIDRAMLESYKAFRLEAEAKGLRHILEVFSPNAPVEAVADVPRFVNDCIVRSLAGVTKTARPVLLKIPYFGRSAMEALVHFDSSIPIGILGGSAGTTCDAFHMLREAKNSGARAAFYGRKINHAEDQLTFVHYLRAIADEQIDPLEAVRAYHAELEQSGIPAFRTLDEDLQRTQV
jgi:hypothetical protein